MDQMIVQLMASATAMRAAGNMVGAASNYQKVIESGDASEDMLAVAHGNLANIQADLGHFDEALANFKVAIDHEKEQRKIGIILSNKARALGNIGELRLSCEMLMRRLAEVEQRGELKELPIALDNAASAHAKLGDLASARKLHAQAAPLFARTDLQGRAKNALSLSNVCNLEGDREGAKRFFGEAHDLSFRFARDHAAIGRYRRGFKKVMKRILPYDHPARAIFWAGVRHKGMGSWAESLRTFEMAAKLAADDGDIAFALRIEANIAATLADMRQVDRSLTLVARIIEQANSLGLARPEFMATALLGSAIMDGADVDDPRGVLGIFSVASALAETHARVVNEFGLPEHLVAFETDDTGAISAQLAKISLEHGDFARSAEYERHALEIARTNYRAIVDATPNGRQATVPFEIANRLAGLLEAERRAGNLEAASKLADELDEFVRAGGLTARGELVAVRMLGDYHEEANPHRAIEYFRKACSLVAELEKAVKFGQGRGDIASGHGDVFRKLARLLRLEGNFVGAFEALQGMKARGLTEMMAKRAGKTSDPLPTFGHVVKLLEELGGSSPTILIEMTVEKTGFTAYQVGSEGIRCVHVEADPSIGAKADQGDVNERPRRLIQYCMENQDIREFVRSIAAGLPKSGRLLLSCSDFLANLPFHVVPYEGRPWIDTHPISYIPAVGALAYSSSRCSIRDRATVAGDSHQDLPFAAEECASVGKSFGVHPLIGLECDAKSILDGLRSGAHFLLHLATHGRGDARRGQRASLLLSNGQGGTEWVDLRNLLIDQVSVRLVVLSGCSTAVVGPRHGHELSGVAQTAAASGASMVLACLWPVEDAVAHQFMLCFYRTLAEQRERRSLDLVDALLNARRSLLEWMRSADGFPAGRRRNGRDLSLDTLEGTKQIRTGALPEALSWAPFVLIGRPVLEVTE